LKRKAAKADLEKNLINETISVAQAMHWDLEYVLNMGIDAYFYVTDFLVEQAKRSESSGQMPATLR